MFTCDGNVVGFYEKEKKKKKNERQLKTMTLNKTNKRQSHEPWRKQQTLENLRNIRE